MQHAASKVFLRPNGDVVASHSPQRPTEGDTENRHASRLARLREQAQHRVSEQREKFLREQSRKYLLERDAE